MTASGPGPTTIFAARRVITFDESPRAATHVAVRNGRILAVGDSQDAAGWGDHRLDDRFAGDVFIPGLIDGHAHSRDSQSWSLGTYVGSFDRHDPDGSFHAACRTADAVVAALAVAHAQPAPLGATLVGWGPDPLLFADGSHLDGAVLDGVSANRPILVIHASGHMAYVNSAAMAVSGLATRRDLEGVRRGSDGAPTGVVSGLTAVLAAYDALNVPVFETPDIDLALTTTAKVARRAGVTAFGDLGTLMHRRPGLLAEAERVTARNDLGLRFVAAEFVQGFGSGDPNQAVAAAKVVLGRGNDRLHFGAVKMASDGSIQGFTARLHAPHYHGTGSNGLWNTPPDELRRWVSVFHAAGFQIHCHCNGDEASEAFIDAVEAALRENPSSNHRHTVQHGQLINDAQFRRMAALGMGANLFANHLYYWGDAHHDITLGPDRAARMDDCSAALRHGVPFTIHSDSPVTPIGPLFTAWCAVNRTTSSGRVLGGERGIGVEDALRAVTIGAAYSLKVDHIVGTIETGKFADFTVLGQDPLAADPLHLKDVPIVATVSGGRVFAD